MNQNIPATLDLAKSLKIFEETIAPALVLQDISQWDGRTLCDREQEIRQAALILAGQCIALLLHSLSQSIEAHSTAAKQTQGWRLPTSTVEAQASGSNPHTWQCSGIPVVALCSGTSLSPRYQAGSQTAKAQRAGVLPVFKMVEHGRPHYPLSLVYYRSVRDTKCFFCCSP